MLLTGLSGNEIYCLAQKGWSPSDVVLGNSVHSLGVVRGLASGFQTMAGGELTNITELIADGRHAAIKRMEEEATRHNASGVTGVTSDLKKVSGLIEFLAIGSAVRNTTHTGPFFTTACSGQDLYCQIDAGYEPRHFVIGNVAYALGVGRGLMGALRGFSGGEVKEFSQMYNHTRHLALQRFEAEAKQRGANAVVDVMTHILPFGPGVKEMLMVGTASHNPVLGNPDRPVTSELTGEELWNLTTLGYQPLRLMLGTSVYALGFSGGLSTFFRSFSRGEIDAVTRLVYEAPRTPWTTSAVRPRKSKPTASLASNCISPRSAAVSWRFWLSARLYASIGNAKRSARSWFRRRSFVTATPSSTGSYSRRRRRSKESNDRPASIDAWLTQCIEPLAHTAPAVSSTVSFRWLLVDAALSSSSRMIGTPSGADTPRRTRLPTICNTSTVIESLMMIRSPILRLRTSMSDLLES